MTQQFFTGVVESRADPLMLGRCKVRVVGIHNEDLVTLPTDDLPWAHPMMPITSASMNGIGHTPMGPVEGTWVIVFFKDGEECQQPIMMGTLGGIPVEYNNDQEYSEVTGIAVDKIKSDDESISPTYTRAETDLGFKDPNGVYPKDSFLEEPDTNRLARNQKVKNTIVDKKVKDRKKAVPVGNGSVTWDQPKIPYNAEYPYNHVMESESGHIIEIDDTLNSTRMNIHSASGTFTEVDVNGSQVNRIVGNGFKIIEKDGHVLIEGTCVVTIKGDAGVYVGGNCSLDVKKELKINADGDMSVKCKSLKIGCSDFNVNSSGKVDVKAGGNIAMDGSQVHMNSGNASPKGPTVEFNPSLTVLNAPSIED